MSHSDKPLEQQTFCFGAAKLSVWCRRRPEEVARVTQTLQLDVDELFANLLDWDIASSSSDDDGGGGEGAPADGAEQQQQQQQSQPPGEQQQRPADARPDSKRLCGGVAADEPDLVGLDVWPAAIALCTLLMAHPALAAGAAVCELGAGMGLPGLLCASLGASQVLLTDYEPVVVSRLADNAALNGLTARCSSLVLDWFDLAALPPAHRHAYDLLLLGDVIYAAAVVGPLVDTIAALLRPATGAALVAHRIRRPLVFDRREKIAKLQERDEIFEAFQAACTAASLRLRFLNGGSAAARVGDEPLLLAIGASEAALQRFPRLDGGGSESGAAGAAPAAI